MRCCSGLFSSFAMRLHSSATSMTYRLENGIGCASILLIIFESSNYIWSLVGSSTPLLSLSKSHLVWLVIAGKNTDISLFVGVVLIVCEQMIFYPSALSLPATASFFFVSALDIVGNDFYSLVCVFFDVQSCEPPIASIVSNNNRRRVFSAK